MSAALVDRLRKEPGSELQLLDVAWPTSAALVDWIWKESGTELQLAAA
ncbi:hypothetical protein [Paenibacillus tyrfis]|nr:hypothetical protein [Paenibacillus tyrfis]MCP1312136.1 hypothetical protein [Paenibacillus tyrfis]